MIFGSSDFCELLRRARAGGLTLSQVQVLSVLAIAPSTVQEIGGLTGLSAEGVVKTVKRLSEIGDVVPSGVATTATKMARVWRLSEQGDGFVRRLSDGRIDG